LDRLGGYSEADREMLVNGAISLYEYMFGAILGADLTAKQGVIFGYLARLLLVVPGATIDTLIDFLEEPETVRPFLTKLDHPLTRRFFERQFFNKSFDDTRQQILYRIYHVLQTDTIARMFRNKRNKVNLFEAMNRGSLILIHTAKDLLKGSWGATEQETGVRQRSPSQNSYFLRKLRPPIAEWAHVRSQKSPTKAKTCATTFAKAWQQPIESYVVMP
jgi:hypothetical protein